MVGTRYCSSTVLSGNIWQELELEQKILTKLEPEINVFGSAALISKRKEISKV